MSDPWSRKELACFHSGLVLSAIFAWVVIVWLAVLGIRALIGAV